MDTLLKPILEFLASLHQFLAKDIWRLDFNKVSRARAIFYRQVLLLYLVARAFVQDRLLVRASALVYATLLSIVPLLAVMFSLLKGFGITDQLEPTLKGMLAPLGPQAVDTLVGPIVNSVNSVSVSAIRAIGLILLFVAVLSIINNIERAFNDIWKIQKVRSLQRRISDYLSILLLGPVLVFTVVILLQKYTVVQTISDLPFLRSIANFLIPYIASWLLFFFLITFVPNTRVRLSSALVGAIIGGTLWQLANLFFARFIVTSYQIGSKAALYAGFAALPLFLIWLFISWATVLLGAEFAYAHQNITKISWEIRNDRYSEMYREAIALNMLILTGEKFLKGEPAPNRMDLADQFAIPERLANQILQELVDQGMLNIVDEEKSRYAPAKSLDSLKISDILRSRRTYGISIFPESKNDITDNLVRRIQEQFDDSLDKTFAELTLRDLIENKKESSA
jgi:membrane protein